MNRGERRDGGRARELCGVHLSDGHRDECRCGELPQLREVLSSSRDGVQ